MWEKRNSLAKLIVIFLLCELRKKCALSPWNPSGLCCLSQSLFDSFIAFKVNAFWLLVHSSCSQRFRLQPQRYDGKNFPFNFTYTSHFICVKSALKFHHHQSHSNFPHRIALRVDFSFIRMCAISSKEGKRKNREREKKFFIKTQKAKRWATSMSQKKSIINHFKQHRKKKVDFFLSFCLCLHAMVLWISIEMNPFRIRFYFQG